MAEPVKIFVLDLIAEFLAHAFVFGRFFHSARTISAARFEPFLNQFYSFLVGIKNYLHNLLS